MKKLAKKQTGGSTKKETAAEQVARMKKEIAAREKRIAERDSINQKNSYTNQRANKVVGKKKMGGATKSKKK